VGSRTSAKTISQILLAFIEEPTWRQADLAKRCGITVKALRPHLVALAGEGIVTADPEPPHVMWSVPRGWFPGGAVLEQADVGALARYVARSPSSEDRERVLRKLLRFVDAPVVKNARRAAVPATVMDLVETSVLDRRPLSLRYHSAHRGEISPMILSVQAVDHGEHFRFVASGASGELRWFRGEGVLDARLTQGAYVTVDGAVLERFLQASVDGFHAGGAPVAYEFFVRFPEARWAARNLPRPLRVTSAFGGVLVRGESAAIPVIAARVVGLGEAARVLSEDLRREVIALARGALRTNERPLRKGDGRAVGSKRATG
jgi:hypothetical protein